MSPPPPVLLLSLTACYRRRKICILSFPFSLLLLPKEEWEEKSLFVTPIPSLNVFACASDGDGDGNQISLSPKRKRKQHDKGSFSRLLLQSVLFSSLGRRTTEKSKKKATIAALVFHSFLFAFLPFLALASSPPSVQELEELLSCEKLERESRCQTKLSHAPGSTFSVSHLERQNHCLRLWHCFSLFWKMKGNPFFLLCFPSTCFSSEKTFLLRILQQ